MGTLEYPDKKKSTILINHTMISRNIYAYYYAHMHPKYTHYFLLSLLQVKEEIDGITLFFLYDSFMKNFLYDVNVSDD